MTENIENIENKTDIQIVNSVLSGRKDDFSEIIRRYKSLVFSVIHRMTNDPHEADDIAQEVFIKIYKNLDKYNPEFKFATWVIRITANHIIDLRRKKRQETVPIDNVEYGIAGEGSPEDDYIKAERNRELFKLIENLPEIYKEPLILYHRDGLSYNEIAERTGETLSKVKNRIFRGRRLLKDSLMKEGESYGMF
ncbi:MAG: sigma-70 family RNA polymerase sigma factor [Clostridiales bacterium]|nr:sigma-70 family RNA polymerase sigma factor [Clostridiales bacterium]